MALKGRYNSDKQRELCPEGVEQAVIYAIYDLGTQKEQYNEEIKLKGKMVWIFEMPNARMSDGRPFAISRKYTKSLHEKAQLRKDVEALLGKSLSEEEIENFNPQDFLATNCLVQIVHNKVSDKIYTNIQGIMKLPKGTKNLSPENKMIAYNIEDAIPEGTPNWIKELIEKSEEKGVDAI